MSYADTILKKPESTEEVEIQVSTKAPEVPTPQSYADQGLHLVCDRDEQGKWVVEFLGYWTHSAIHEVLLKMNEGFPIKLDAQKHDRQRMIDERRVYEKEHAEEIQQEAQAEEALRLKELEAAKENEAEEKFIITRNKYRDVLHENVLTERARIKGVPKDSLDPEYVKALIEEIERMVNIKFPFNKNERELVEA